MMKWGSKKKKTPTSSSSSSHSSSTSQSLISNAFSRSWFSRFKNVKGGSESEEVNVKGKGSSVSPKSWVSSDDWDGGRFYGRDDDSCWSLSFRKDRLKGEVGKCGLKPGRYNSDDELQFSPLHVVSQRRMASESNCGKVELRTRKTRGLKHQKPEQESRRIWEEGKEFQRKSDKGRVSFERSVEKDVFEVKLERINSQKNSRRQHRISFSNSIDLGTIEEDCIFEGLRSEQSDTFSEDGLSQNRKNKKVSDIILRNENQKASLHLRKERQRRRMRMKQSRKVKVCSPRSAAKIECKIKALEDMKRARVMETKKMMVKDETVKNTTNFDSFAVVKCSVDPEGDFKESMVEMIREKGIRQPEVMEELLACYLTLNSGEYHDLIVKVFREVWLELNQAQFYQELDIMNCGYL